MIDMILKDGRRKIYNGNKMVYIEKYEDKYMATFYEDGFRANLIGINNGMKFYNTEKGAVSAGKRFLNK